ncbi:hypothetical protein [Albimonas pacifica]|uniref:Uncharacterized protein n=1 Tax=Albimonas pacifica TaxID=1114924 RepID=A0A1I3EG66_9RHOB|nr:hypothetical protein [Albimonas pacifica]SFH97873.1 hypothetical protein SAMN05216258_103355 [Albimonas pacifica]
MPASPPARRTQAAAPAGPGPDLAQATSARPGRRVLSARPLGAAEPPQPAATPARPRSRAAAAAFDPPPPHDATPSRGHNQGPPLHGGFLVYAWRRAQAEAWTPPRPEVLRRRLKYAAECGLTLREYTLEIMERGRWLTPEKDAARIAQIKSLRR